MNDIDFDDELYDYDYPDPYGYGDDDYDDEWYDDWGYLDDVLPQRITLRDHVRMVWRKLRRLLTPWRLRNRLRKCAACGTRNHEDYEADSKTCMGCVIPF